ncbi:MAG: hypothetical protein IT161_23970 [Bryobacterales bacterium]|nr:hypothetical protein [Bryobacterales bacterium]
MEIDYLPLASILATPDERMDSHVIEGLHVITAVGRDENFDELLDMARRNFIEVDLEATACDLAARIWLVAPEMLQLKDRGQMVDRRRKFESFRARDPEVVVPLEKLPFDLSPLQMDLEECFQSKKRGIGCVVVRTDVGTEAHFLIQHGQPCKRVPSRKGAQSTCTLLRPEQTDKVIYDPVHNELRMNASGPWDLRLYREKFGRHLFGDPNMFVYAEKYTLAPLQRCGPAALHCRDVGGMERVWLVDLEYASDGPLNLVERVKADDVFQALAMKNRSIEPDVEIRRAAFEIKLQGASKPRPVEIQPRNIAKYGRGEEAAIIERWLHLREFVLVGAAAEDERFESVLALA